MRILIASRITTDPATQGNSQSTSAWSAMLGAMGHDVWYAWAYNTWHKDHAQQAAMRARWGDKLIEHPCGLRERLRDAVLHRLVVRLGYSYRRDDHLPYGFVERLRRLDRTMGFDAVIANYYCMSGVFRAFPKARKVVYTHDVFSDLRERTGSTWMTTSPREEGAALDRADHVLSIQETESVFLRGLTSTPVTTAWSPVEPAPTPSAGKTRNLLFLGGTLRWNVEGIRAFAREAGPLIHARLPEFKLVVGGGVCASVADLADLPFVELVGRVDALEGFYARGSVCLNPVSTGTGLKIKSIEAMARGKTLLCHPHSAEGMPDLERAPVFAYGSPGEAADLACRLLQEDREGERSREAVSWVEGLNARCREAFVRALEG
jgi:hypothetical protein